MEENNSYLMSITELSFLVMFILIMFIINMLIHINNVNSDDYVLINKINYQTQKSMAEKSDEFRQNLVDQISINKKLFDNINELKKVLENTKNNNEKLKKELSETSVVIKKRDAIIAEYKNKYGNISNIPPDCSKAGIIASYLFEALLLSDTDIAIGSEVVKINEIGYLYKNDLEKAKNNDCIHKIKLYITKELNTKSVIMGEKNLQRYFYVVKEMKND